MRNASTRPTRRFAGLFLTFLPLQGCSQHVAHFVPPSVPVRLGEELTNVKVYVPGADGTLLEARATLRPGVWISYDPREWPLPSRESEMDLRRDKEP